MSELATVVLAGAVVVAATELLVKLLLTVARLEVVAARSAVVATTLVVVVLVVELTAGLTLYRDNPFGPPQIWLASAAHFMLHRPSVAGKESLLRILLQKHSFVYCVAKKV